MHMTKKFLTFAQGLAFVAVAGLWWQPATAEGLFREPPTDKWQSTVWLYLWGLSMDGTGRIAGNDFEVDIPFSDIWDNLDAAFALHFESQKGQWGYFIDGMYARIKPTEETPAGNIDLDVKNFIGEAGGIYHFNPTVGGHFGVRYQDMSVDLDLPGPLPTVGSDQNWIDAIVGLRVVPVNGENWKAWLRGDVGTGDSDFTWSARLGIGYWFNERWSVAGIYGILSNDIEDGDFKWDVDYSGLSLAVGYTF